MLVDDTGRATLRPGDCASFPKGDRNGHCLINESAAPCTFVAIGRPPETDCHYPDIDMHLFAGQGFRRKDGSGFAEGRGSRPAQPPPGAFDPIGRASGVFP